MTRAVELIVVGGGIVGLCCARELARRGYDVELVDAGRPGGEASGAAAGMLAPLAEAGREPAFFELCREARDDWPRWAAELAAETGLDVDLDQSGALYPILDADDEDRAEELWRLARRHGEPVTELDPTAMTDRAPGVAPGRRALLFEREWRVDNQCVLAALVRSVRTAGVRIRGDCPVRSLDLDARPLRLELGDDESVTAERVVVTAGAWSSRLLADRLPVAPVRGEMLAFRAPPGWRWPGILLGGDSYLVARASGDLLVGATVEAVGFDRRTTARGRELLLEWTRRRVPALARREPDDHWAGLRPGSPDGRPLLGRLDRTDLLVACGHFRNGILLAPWTGERIAELVENDGVAVPPCVDVDRLGTL